MMVAAIASNSRPTAIVELPDESSALCSRPVSAAAIAEIIMTRILMRLTGMPDSPAAFALPPTA